MNKKYAFALWIVIGIVAMAFIGVATTIIKDTGITTGDSQINGRLNISVQNDGLAYPNLNVVNRNSEMSAIWVSGNESDTGTIKISHNGYLGDATSSAISVDLKGTQTEAKGLFISATDGGKNGTYIQVTNTQHNLWLLRNESQSFYIPTHITETNETAFLVEDDIGTDMFRVDTDSSITFTKKLVPITTDLYEMGDSTKKWRAITASGNITSGQFIVAANTTVMTCAASTEGAIYYDGQTKKHYGCNGTTWNALY